MCCALAGALSDAREVEHALRCLNPFPPSPCLPRACASHLRSKRRPRNCGQRLLAARPVRQAFTAAASPAPQAVLAHELGHLKCDHGVWLTAANVLAMGTVSLLPVVSSAVEEGLLRWLRAAELTCDRAALLVAQDRWARPPRAGSGRGAPVSLLVAHADPSL